MKSTATKPSVSKAAAAQPAAAKNPVGKSTVAKAELKKLEFNTEIDAPVEKVWDFMFSVEGYPQWTRAFWPGLYYQGSWAEGERIRFLAPTEGSGLVAEIAVNRPYEFLSIKYLGTVAIGVEDTTSDRVRAWAPAYENYRFTSVNGGTLMTVEHEVLASDEAFMVRIWLKALASLKLLCEAD